MNFVSSILRGIQFIWATLLVTLKQLIAQRGLTLAIMLGLVTAISMTMGIPIYADAVYQDVLIEQLEDDEGQAETAIQPPFAFMYRYIGSWSGPVAYQDTLAADEYLSRSAAQDMHLPLELFVRYYRIADMRLFSTEDSNYADPLQNLSYISLASLSGLEERITLLEGRLPGAEPVDGHVEILVSENLANTLGLQSGEEYIAYERLDTAVGEIRAEIPIRIAGIWRASNAQESYWFYNLSEFNTVLFAHPQAFIQHILPAVNNEVNLALWYMVMDGSRVKSSDVNRVIGRIQNTRQHIFNLLPGIRLDISPLERLEAFDLKARNLTNFLYAFSLPLLGMVLTFIGLVSAMVIEQRRGQIATLRSRGATASQLVGMAAFEASILGLLSVLISIPLAMLIAFFIGRTRSFLDFSAGSSLPVRMPETAWQAGLLVALFAILAQVIPVLQTSRHTIVTYKQERARQVKPPWWQRAWLDVLLLIPTGYGIFLMQKSQGSLGGLPNDPFQNPLILLLPALGIFSLILILLRLLPYLMRLIAWLTGKTLDVGFLLAARHLSRRGSGFHAPVILLVFTLSLSTFTSSMAQTLDQYLYDKNYYEIGADISLDESGQPNPKLLSGSIGPQAASEQIIEQGTEDGPRWYFLPVSEHLRAPGVQAAARIGHAQARLHLPNGIIQGAYLGVDRVDFPLVSFWRADFAPEPLGALMNHLALTSEGVLIPRRLLETHNLLLGDTLIVTVSLQGTSVEMSLKVVGVFDLFPTWMPAEGPLVVGNLDYLYEQLGGEFPYDVWVNTESGAISEEIVKGLEDLDIIILYHRATEEYLNAEQLRPERQGVFGLLSVGFLALAILTVLGFFLYALFSFRSRLIELGVLRAVGLSARQLVVYLAAELTFLLSIGLAAGTCLGVWASRLFIPSLQMGSGPESQIPPFVIHIDWISVFRIYILFGFLFITALVTLSALLLRMKIFQAIKLGETN
jgi:putative ABC transport system permease protein